MWPQHPSIVNVITDQVDVQTKDEEDSVCLIAFPRFPYQVYIVQGYEDDPEPEEDDEDASYADEEYKSTKKKAPKKKKQPTKPRGVFLHSLRAIEVLLTLIK